MYLFQKQMPYNPLRWRRGNRPFRSWILLLALIGLVGFSGPSQAAEFPSSLDISCSTLVSWLPLLLYLSTFQPKAYSTLSYTFNVSLAVFSQENSLACVNPLDMRFLFRPPSVKTAYTASAKFLVSLGLTNMAVSPKTSGSYPALDATTGQPQAIASRGGNPNPS